MLRLCLLLCCSLLSLPLQAQFANPPRLTAGGSLGFGGLHMYGKPAFHLRYHTTTLNLAPGTHFLSIGLTQRLYAFQSQRRCGPVQAIASAAWHDDWLLMPLQRERRGNGHIRDLDGWNLLVGAHMDLNPLRTVYLQVSGGFLYLIEKYRTPEGAPYPPANRQFLYPMAEVRLGVWIHLKPRNGIFSKPVQWY
ncbi:MAG: hypothetical protein KF690_11080 [Bacteroidetes bacterium]|nr:hypothetical protein [Bacteroidota bacterium]